jgi:ABC-type Mn2+/Zn2+ transport system ATPase subunit
VNNHLFSIEKAAAAHRGKTVLRDITISLMPGEFLGIIGPNGAGKSTLLMTVIGFRDIYSGEATVFGKDIRTLDMHGWAGIRKKIGYLPQKPSIDPFFPITVEEVVLMGRIGYNGLFRNYTKDDRMTAEKCMEDMGLIDLRKRPIGRLSGGEQQKVHITRILTQDPDLILLDEPLSGLDLRWQQKIGEIIEDIAGKGGKGIVMVTHEAQHLPPSCQKVVLINKGEIMSRSTKKEFFSDALLSKLYGCNVESFLHDGRIYLSPWDKNV